MNAWTVVALMAVVTMITRIGGVWLMQYVPVGETTKRFIGAMSGSVLIAFIAPIFVHGDIATKIALIVTLLAMLVKKNTLIAITCGMATAAAMRYFWSI